LLTLKFFADDLKLYLRVLNSNDVNLLQRALDVLVDWENAWQLSISVNKMFGSEHRKAY